MSYLIINTTNPEDAKFNFPLQLGQKFVTEWPDIDDSTLVKFSGFDIGLTPEQIDYIDKDSVIWYYMLEDKK